MCAANKKLWPPFVVCTISKCFGFYVVVYSKGTNKSKEMRLSASDKNFRFEDKDVLKLDKKCLFREFCRFDIFSSLFNFSSFVEFFKKTTTKTCIP